jgi:spermidine dehydrogenase
MTSDEGNLGMTSNITRRDFLNGVAVGVGGAMAAPSLAEAAAGQAAGAQTGTAATANPAYYPPASTGMRGSHAGSFEAMHRVRDARGWKDAATDTGEHYDLVVVGGGISGLSAAHYFRAAVGSNASVLVLDNHDDFGGHAKRNEFSHDGRMLMLNGGTLNIESPQQYSDIAMGLLRRIGIDIDRFERETEHDRGTYQRMGLKNAVFFPKEKFGEDRLVIGSPGGNATSEQWREFVAKAPVSDQVRGDLARLQSKDQPDYMAGLSDVEKKRQLLQMSYQDFLLKVAKVHPDAAWYHQARTTGLFLMMTDAVPAYYGWNSGYPGFQGMKLEPTPREVLYYEPGGAHGRENQARANEGGRSVHFPDGNATIARLLVRSLLPDAVPGSTQEDIVTARVDYAKLDRDGAHSRIRLNSSVVHVAHRGDPAAAHEVEVTYVTGGQARMVRGTHVVLACWNSIIPYLCPELPAKQREALAYGIKAPIVYTNVFIRNWTALARLGVANITAPGGFHPTVQLAEPVTVGQYQCSRTPEEPIVLHLVRTPCAPGKPRQEQHRAGRAELLSMPFETFEREIRSELGRMLGGGGFDPARDILAITVNRWPHGYTYNYNTLADPIAWSLATPEDRACVVGRQPFGRIAIANADAAGSSHTDAAIEQAYRAVREVVELRAAEYVSRFTSS